MVGQNVYQEEEIKFILALFIAGKEGPTITDEYDAKFGKRLTPNQLRYVKNKYGKDPKYNTVMVNTIVSCKKSIKRKAEGEGLGREKPKEAPFRETPAHLEQELPNYEATLPSLPAVQLSIENQFSPQEADLPLQLEIPTLSPRDIKPMRLPTIPATNTARQLLEAGPRTITTSTTNQSMGPPQISPPWPNSHLLTGVGPKHSNATQHMSQMPSSYGNIPYYHQPQQPNIQPAQHRHYTSEYPQNTPGSVSHPENISAMYPDNLPPFPENQPTPLHQQQYHPTPFQQSHPVDISGISYDNSPPLGNFHGTKPLQMYPDMLSSSYPLNSETVYPELSPAIPPGTYNAHQPTGLPMNSPPSYGLLDSPYVHHNQNHSPENYFHRSQPGHFTPSVPLQISPYQSMAQPTKAYQQVPQSQQYSPNQPSHPNSQRWAYPPKNTAPFPGPSYQLPREEEPFNQVKPHEALPNNPYDLNPPAGYETPPAGISENQYVEINQAINLISPPAPDSTTMQNPQPTNSAPVETFSALTEPISVGTELWADQAFTLEDVLTGDLVPLARRVSQNPEPSSPVSPLTAVFKVKEAQDEDDEFSDDTIDPRVLNGIFSTPLLEAISSPPEELPSTPPGPGDLGIKPVS
ncbi:hypothetical protein G7046_g1167 [Stylonectria norvegica]|nr:hypothetical protein G7046_g1167 [Stylonectria norvegica]